MLEHAIEFKNAHVTGYLKYLKMIKIVTIGLDKALQK